MPLAPSELVTPDFILSAYLGTPIAIDDDRIVGAVDFANGAQTIAAQPDCPRNITVALADANASITAGTITIAGFDVSGDAVSEVVTFTQAIAGYTGTRIYARIASVTVAAVAGTVGAGADQLKVGVGNVIGLPSPIKSAIAIKHVYLGGTRVASPTVATGRYNSGVNVAASTYNGTKALQVFYNPVE